MPTIARPTPQHAPTTPQVTLGRDRDGDRIADSTGSRITHFDLDGVDRFQLDAPDPMSPADLADHITAARALLDAVDPTGTNRRRPAPSLDEQAREVIAENDLTGVRRGLNHFTAVALTRRLTIADAEDRAVWERAEQMLTAHAQLVARHARDLDAELAGALTALADHDITQLSDDHTADLRHAALVDGAGRSVTALGQAVADATRVRDEVKVA